MVTSRGVTSYVTSVVGSVLILAACCWGQDATRTVCPSRKYDIVFALDSSTSIDRENWKATVEFVASLINQSSIAIGKDSSRVGLIIFNETAENVFYLNTFEKKEDVIAEILSTPLKYGDTNIAAAIRRLRDEQFVASRGDRPEAPNIAVIISDGYSNHEDQNIEGERNNSINVGIHIFALGIGATVLERNMRLIASPSGDEKKNYWMKTDYETLSELTVSMGVLLDCTIYPAPCAEEPCEGSQSCAPASALHADHTIICRCNDGFTPKYCYPESAPVLPSREDCSWTAEEDRPKTGPQLHMICPNYGPESGGTDVHIWGNHFDDVERIVVIIGHDFPCEMLFHNQTFIQCLTTTNKGTDTTNRKLPLTIQDGGHNVTEMAEAFTYKPDPIVKSIHPQTSFVAGGTPITVLGENLDSVAEPIMQLSMRIRDEIGGDGLFPSECKVINSTVATCPAPEVKIPDYLYQFLGDNCRYVHQAERIANGEDYDVECTMPVEFYAGMKFDGVNLPESSPFSVYPNPTVTVFPDGGIRQYDPTKETSLDIYGEKFNRGATAEDYIIKIGVENCSDVVIQSNAINCVPPRVQPEPTEERFSREGAPRVEIFVGNHKLTPGYLKYVIRAEVKMWDKPEMKYPIIVICIILGLLLVVALCKYFLSSVRLMIERHHLYSISREYDDCGQLNEAMPIMNLLSADLRAKLQDSLIPSDKLVLKEVIGAGQFGVVHLGLLKTDDAGEKTVAVKSIKDRGALSYDVVEFLKEATLMKQFDHPNILPLLGIVIRDNNPFVVTPYMENQDLKSFLRDKGKDLGSNQLLKMARDVANGMLCLASRKFVHRDLAARNCMVNERLDVKIADFGLSRDMYNSEYYRADLKRCPLPIRWMAPESLTTGLFTIKSDVWSYGIVLWETLSLGTFPYIGISNLALRRRLKAGHRLEQPELATDEVYKIMTDCWNVDPKLRPSFSAIVLRLTRILSSDYHKLPASPTTSNYLTMPDHPGNIYLDLTPAFLQRTDSNTTDGSDATSEGSIPGPQSLDPLSVANLISYFANSQNASRRKTVDETGYLIPVHK